MKNILRKGSLRGTVGAMALLTLVAWTMLVIPGQALAVPVIDFEQGATTGGTLTIVGGNAVGANIPLSVAKLVDTPSNAGSYSMTAYLNFDTGASSNFITVTGWIPSLGLGSASNPLTLLSGSFSSFSIIPTPSGFSVFGTGPDVKHEALVAAAGLPSDIHWAFFGFTISSGENGTVVSAGIKNTAVPEPSALLLMGSALAGLGLWGYRKRVTSRV